MNVRLTLEYDGTGFLGWQRQAEDPTVQGEIEKAIERVVGRRIPVRAAGRTDSGVSAMAQVANFHCDRFEAARWRSVLNGLLPPTIRVIEAREVPEAFDAQRDARSKIYEYRVLNRAFASALDRRVYFYPGPLDWDTMAACLPAFVGTKDFRAFQGAGATVKTTVRTVHRFELARDSETPGAYVFRVEGDGFLKQMVRAMVGTVMEVGEGRRAADDIAEVIASKDRRRAGRTVPAEGLCLIAVNY